MGGTDRSGVDVAIVGGGIIGCTIAYELARKGVSVAVIERREIGREASWASAGIIAPPSAAAASPVRLELTARSLSAYPWFVAAIQEETEVDVGYRQCGELFIATSEREAANLRHLVAWQEEQGFDTEWVDLADLPELEPVLPPGVRAAALSNDAGSLILHRLTRATATAAARRGARIIEHTPALGVELDGDRVAGVRLPDGVLPAGQVVLAAGAWTGWFGPSLGITLPTVPVKGQMMAIGGVDRIPAHIISGAGGFLVPRTDGTVAVAATVEEAGFDTRVTPAGLRELTGLVAALEPSLLAGEVVATWAGLRPGTPDGEPIMGLVPGYQGLWISTGHFRTGAQQAIGAAEVMVASILSGTPDPLLASVGVERFGP